MRKIRDKTKVKLFATQFYLVKVNFQNNIILNVYCEIVKLSSAIFVCQKAPALQLHVVRVYTLYVYSKLNYMAFRFKFNYCYTESTIPSCQTNFIN